MKNNCNAKLNLHTIDNKKMHIRQNLKRIIKIDVSVDWNSLVLSLRFYQDKPIVYFFYSLCLNRSSCLHTAHCSFFNFKEVFCFIFELKC